jgi:cytoplasmic iron level regulating protein YaaA (DUF328/UPF0246 family)
MNDKVKSSPDIDLSLPRFQNEADCFARDMVQYSAETIAEMLGCSLQIAAQNRLRYMRFFEDAPKLPAILAYHGQAYKHLKAETLNVDNLNYSQEKLWITSFLYGLLRPLDAILPYRMEGHVELPSGEGQNMIIENRIDKPEDLCAFSYEGFSYEPKLGEPDYPHFIKN